MSRLPLSQQGGAEARSGPSRTPPSMLSSTYPGQLLVLLFQLALQLPEVLLDAPMPLFCLGKAEQPSRMALPKTTWALPHPSLHPCILPRMRRSLLLPASLGKP